MRTAIEMEAEDARPLVALRPSEAAETIAAMIADMNERAVQQMYRALGHHLAAPTNGQLRHNRLGLLVALLADKTGEVPSHKQYEKARTAHAAIGEQWLSAVAVSNAYGGWIPAVRAAMKLTHGLSGGVGDGQHTPNGVATAAYTREEADWAIEECAQFLGCTPRPGDYAEWHRLRLRHARVHGNPLPRLPPLDRVRALDPACW